MSVSSMISSMMKGTNDIMTPILGSNWRTALSGYGESAFGYMITYLYNGGAIPNTKEGWALLGMSTLRAVTAYNTKDKQVTNSQNPSVEGHVAAEVVASKNP